MVQSRQRQLIGSPEEIAFAFGYIDADELLRQAAKLGKSEYGRALKAVAAHRTGGSDD